MPEDISSIPGLGGVPLEEEMAAHSIMLRNPLDERRRGAWRATVQEATKVQTRLSMTALSTLGSSQYLYAMNKMFIWLLCLQ